jgi:hypothetical protein
MACFEFEIGLEEAENHFKTKLSRSFRPFSEASEEKNGRSRIRGDVRF